MSETEINRKLFEKIKALSLELGFSACGCAKAEELASEEKHYMAAEKVGCFADMDYLKRNIEKRFNPALLVPGAKSVLVFLAPFGHQASGMPISEFARGLDYHIIIKEKLYKILSLIKGQENCSGLAINDGRVFTDSAPILERAWAVRAGLGFIGKNNFFISPECGVKNFIGIIITTAVLPYYADSCNRQTSSRDFLGRSYEMNNCGVCTKCIDACSTGALGKSHFFDARKCLSYKTIEEKLQDTADSAGNCSADIAHGKSKWIFGCDDCMNACPWNCKNKEGWPEFSTNEKLLAKATPKWWQALDEQEFKKLFEGTPLMRAGLKKIQDNIKNFLP